MNRLTENDGSGNWQLKGVSWQQLYIGQPLTKEVQERLYGALFKLMEYENSGLTPDEVQKLAEKEKPMPVRKTIPVTPGEERECPNCGNDLSIMDVYAGRCKYCGQKIEEARRTRNGR